MSNQAGILTFTDLSQVQKTRENSELGNYLGKMRVTRSTDLTNDIAVIFQNGSARRSNFFMDFRYRDYASMMRGLNYQMPVYGVKGLTPKITRDARYVELLMCEEKELAGAGFNDLIFGTSYLTGEETVSLTDRELVAAMSDGGSAVSCSVRPEMKETVCHVVEKIWEALENDPKTRFIIRMKRAESRSMALLQQVYALLPLRLKLQTGFETNIAAADLQQIDKSGIPIYVLTMDKAEAVEKDRFSFPVVIFDLDNEGGYSYDAAKLAQIRQLAENMNAKLATDLDDAEKAYLEARELSSSSFKYYGSFLSSLATGGDYWWKRDRFDSVEDLQKAYERQADLMKTEDYRKDAMTALYTKIYPSSDLANQTVAIVTDPKYQGREGLLNFLAGELGQKKQLEAIWGLKQTMDKRTRAALEKAEGDKQAALTALQADLAAKHAAAIKQTTERAETAEQAGRELKAANQKLQKELQTIEDEKGKLQAVLDRNPGGQEAIEENEKLKKALKATKEGKAAAEKTRTILGIVAGVLGVAAILFAVLWLTKKTPAPATAPTPTPAVETTVAPTEAAEAAEPTEAPDAEVTPEATEPTEAAAPTEVPAETGTADSEDAEAAVTPEAETGEAVTGEDETVPGAVPAVSGTVADDLAVIQGANPTMGLEDESFADNEWLGEATSVYYHIKFADDENGTGSSEDPTKPYIGLYVSTQEPDNERGTLDDGSAVYQWQAVSELDASKGIAAAWFDEPEQVYYLHLAYADGDRDETTFSTTESEGKTWIGWLVDRKEADEPSAYAYTWMPRTSAPTEGGISGEDSQSGLDYQE